jgi:hypothetical protein
MSLAIGDTPRGLGRIKVTAEAIVTKLLLIFILFLADFLHAFGRTETRISVSLLDKSLCMFLIDFAPLCLTVRAKRSANIRAFVKWDSQPAQTVHDLLFGAFHKSFLVGIFEPQNKLSARLTSKQIIE